MTGAGAEGAADLGYEVVESAPIPLALTDLTPDGQPRGWAPLSTTLVFGARDAVLIDPPLTAAQAAAVGDRVQARGRRLTHIVVTHAHGDHWFTAAALAERFPGAQVVAAPGTIAQMHRTVAAREAFWDVVLPGQIPPSPVIAVAVPDNRIGLEGHEVVIVEVGHSDTDDTTVVHVPDLGLVVAGDVVYDGVHPFLVESAHGGRDAWRRAIDLVEDLQPRHLVAGHSRPGLDHDGIRPVAETRRYLDDVDDLLGRHASALDFFTAMRERHPDRLGVSTLWGGAMALYGTATPSSD